MAQDQKDRIDEHLSRGLKGLWYVVAKSSDLKTSKVLAVRALGRELALWRDSRGKIGCVEDFCPHRGARLSAGRVTDGHIACNYHGVQLDANGVVAKVPALPNCILEGRKAIDAFSVFEAHDAIFAYFPSADRPRADPPTLPFELTGGDYSSFLTTSVWRCNYRYALENVADPMHGPYLHGDTFTLSGGAKQDEVELTTVDDGFTVARVAQQGENFDWAHVVTEAGLFYMRVNIPYPPAGGPGGIMRVVTCVTPIDENSCRIFFWRTRKVSGLAREVWRFMFRAAFEERHWYVLEQDRNMLESLAPNARDREMLYQHDIGVTRLRQMMRRMAKTQIEAESRDAPRTAAE